jgi:pyridoxamine 5'-phosphate oxidase
MTIEISKASKEKPYLLFKEHYESALKKNQKFIEAISISSFNKDLNEVQSRIVNLKYIINDEWIFFSNYLSPKSKSFETHNQISAIFYWDSINTQIRIKAHIKKTSGTFSNKHFLSRTKEKNALAISSNQSERISSYDDVINDYERVLKDYDKNIKRPEYWGGFSFEPYYFEFWEGHESRLNKREIYELHDNEWSCSYLQP